MRRLRILLALVLPLFCLPSSSAKVFLRITPGPIPAAAKLGVHDLVLTWPVENQTALANLSSLGYSLFLQCETKDLAAVAEAAERSGIAGVIVVGALGSGTQSLDQARTFAAGHPKLTFRFLASGGKQPQMKGRLVVERDGVLQVSSPSSQPWLDTNFASVRLAQSATPDLVPVLYDFHWEARQAPADAWNPDDDAFALAIGEAAAMRSDVIIDLPDRLSKALTSDNHDAWYLWHQIQSYLAFFSSEVSGGSRPIANIGAVVDGSSSYEAVNLMARHNLAFEAVRPSDLSAARLHAWNSVVVFCPLGKDTLALLREFAQGGAIVIFVNSHDDFPWHAAPPAHQESHSATYNFGAGQIVELSQPVVDPEDFARDLRRLIGAERSALALWNSLTTVVTGYREEPRSDVTLYVLNYADQPDNVQVQIKGRFTGVQLESPEAPHPVVLPSAVRNGFTEFTIPSLRIAARVHLRRANENSARP